MSTSGWMPGAAPRSLATYSVGTFWRAATFTMSRWPRINHKVPGRCCSRVQPGRGLVQTVGPDLLE
eukprot:5616385-Pyramimonas_sp.AAC.1